VLDEAKGYVYCTHCDDVISRSTYERHERKRYSVLSNSTRQSTVESCNLDLLDMFEAASHFSGCVKSPKNASF